MDASCDKNNNNAEPVRQSLCLAIPETRFIHDPRCNVYKWRKTLRHRGLPLRLVNRVHRFAMPTACRTERNSHPPTDPGQRQTPTHGGHGIRAKIVSRSIAHPINQQRSYQTRTHSGVRFAQDTCKDPETEYGFPRSRNGKRPTTIDGKPPKLHEYHDVS